MAIVKIATTIFIQLEFWDSVKDLVLSPFSNENIELILIMLVIPLFVNILIFWVTDNFLMRHDHQKKAHHGNNNQHNINCSIHGLCNGNGNSSSLCSCFNGKSTKTLLQRVKVHYKNNFSNHNNSSFLKENDSESDALISGNEDNTDEDNIVMYDDRIELERCGIGMGGSTSSIDLTSARRNHRSSFIVNP